MNALCEKEEIEIKNREDTIKTLASKVDKAFPDICGKRRKVHFLYDVSRGSKVISAFFRVNYWVEDEKLGNKVDTSYYVKASPTEKMTREEN